MKLYNDRRLVGVLGSKSIKKYNNDLLEIVETMECIEKEIFELQAEKRYDCYYGIIYLIILDMPGQLIMMRFAAFRDIELRYFGNLDQRTSIASYNRTRFADHLLLQNCKNLVVTLYSNYRKLWCARTVLFSICKNSASVSW